MRKLIIKQKGLIIRYRSRDVRTPVCLDISHMKKNDFIIFIRRVGITNYKVDPPFDNVKNIVINKQTPNTEANPKKIVYYQKPKLIDNKITQKKDIQFQKPKLKLVDNKKVYSKIEGVHLNREKVFIPQYNYCNKNRTVSLKYNENTNDPDVKKKLIFNYEKFADNIVVEELKSNLLDDFFQSIEN